MNQPNNPPKDKKMDIFEAREDLSATGENIAKPNGGTEVVRFISRYGKKLFNYHVNLAENQFDKFPSKENNPEKSPPFLVIGLGRCGCHITADLAQIIASFSPKRETIVGENQEKNKNIFNKDLRELFRPSKSSPVLKFQPIMLIGDIDETAFQDVDGLLEHGGVTDEVKTRLIQLNYKPIAEGGAGHVPLFSEFLTKGILLLPHQSENKESDWREAKKFLTNNFFNSLQLSRLVFYIFSTGGGSGSGGAPEIMKAQRYAMSISNKPEPQIYFTGVGVLPQAIRKDRKTLINTGRNIIRYLADLNISLNEDSDYGKAPNFQASAVVDRNKGLEPTKIMPWDGLALISNDVMSAMNDYQPLTLEEVESNTNQYIAQQIFNLAAAQFSVARFDKDEDVQLTRENYQTIRLDPQDLKNGLVGPYGICFSVANSNQFLDKQSLGLDKMFLRAIGLPKYYSSERGENISSLIEGISVAPTDKKSYGDLLKKLWKKLEVNSLEAQDFEEIKEIELFQKCPRVVFVFTAPQDGRIDAHSHERISTLIEWLFPNLQQRRLAVVRGTTAYYTLSIYIETSVILTPDIQSAIKNYLKLCWKQRTTSPEKFKQTYKEFIEQQPPILDEKVAEWLGETENYGVEVNNFNTLKDELNSKWQNYLGKNSQELLNNPYSRDLTDYRVESTYMLASEVASALRFINYANRFELPDIILD